MGTALQSEKQDARDVLGELGSERWQEKTLEQSLDLSYTQR